MHQGSGMQQFDQGGRDVRSLLSSTAGRSGQIDEQGPHLLAFAAHDVPRDVVQKRHRGAHGFLEVPLKLTHFEGHGLSNGGKVSHTAKVLLRTG